MGRGFKRKQDPVDDYIRAEGFYYKEKSREEAEKARYSGRGKIVKYDRTIRNRRIVYMDLIIILIMMGVLIPFAQKYLNRQEGLYGYKADWDYSFGRTQVYHTLTIKAPESFKDEEIPQNHIIEALFTATGGESVIVTELPPKPGEDRLITAEIPLDDLPDYVGCTVKIGEKEKTFKTYTGKVRAIPFLKRPAKDKF